MGLTNLAQMCRQHPRERWAEIVRHHFDVIEKSEREARDWKAEQADFSKARDRLHLRVYGKDEFGDALSRLDVIAREDIPGTMSTLVADLPNRIQTLRKRDVANWGQSEESLLKIGLENVRTNCAIQIARQEKGESVEVFAAFADHFFVSTFALLPEALPVAANGRMGELIGIPNRHIFLCFPINDLTSTVRAVNALANMISKMEREGPGSVSSQLYWRHNGKFTPLPYSIKDKALHFAPPDEFVGVLNSLAADSKAESGESGAVKD